jgi:biopolymer transport protein ExbB
MSFISNIVAAFGHGGFVMWIIFFGQIFSIAIILERIYVLYITKSINSRSLASQFETDIKNGRLDHVIQKAENLSQQDNALGKAILAGAQAAANHGGKDEIQSKMDEVLLSENSVIEKRTGFLASIGNVATLAGLLGTIIGLIDSFTAVANSNPLEKASLLSQGISMAMYATAYGLIIAIPALVMFAVLQNRANSLTEDLNQTALKVFNWLTYSYEPTVRKATK